VNPAASHSSRRRLSNETGTIQATVINGDGTTNVIRGLVGRNHLFWIEHVPLNGTNEISLQTADASGTNTAPSNLMVNPSAITLTIDYKSTVDDLCTDLAMRAGG
jgi:hypothetical protein